MLLLLACHPASISLDDSAKTHADDSAIADSQHSTNDSDDTSSTESGTTETETTETTTPDCSVYGFMAVTQAHLQNGASVDSYDATVGAYGGNNVGQQASVTVDSTGKCALTVGASVGGDVWTGADPSTGLCEEFGSAISGSRSVLPSQVSLPIYQVPAGLPASSGALSIGFGDTRNIAVNTVFDSLSLDYGGNLQTSASLILYVAGDFSTASTLKIAAGTTVDLYVDGTVHVGFGSELNTDGEPSRLRIHAKGDINLEYGAHVAALIEQGGSFSNAGGTLWGTWMGDSANLQWGAMQHVDVSRYCP